MAGAANTQASAVYAKIFVELQAALGIAWPRAANKLREVLDPANLWALSVLLSQRAYRDAEMVPVESTPNGVVIATDALGTLASSAALDPLWPLLQKAGLADTSAEIDAAASTLATALSRVGVDMLTTMLSTRRLRAFREAAAKIAAQPSPLPTKASVLADASPDAAGETASPTTSNLAPTAIKASSASKGAKALAIGVPVAGGLLLLYGAYRHFKAAKKRERR